MDSFRLLPTDASSFESSEEERKTSGEEEEARAPLVPRTARVAGVVLAVLCSLVFVAASVRDVFAREHGQFSPEASSTKMPFLKDADALTSAWDASHVEHMCKGRQPEGLPVFDDDDEDEDDEEIADGKPPASKSKKRRLKEAVVAVKGIRRFRLKGGATMPYYGSQDIQQDLPSDAEFAIFVFHGAVRDAINYFCAGKRLMETQQKYPLDKSLLIVLKWHYEIDKPIGSDVWWNSSKPWGSWMAGGNSDKESGVSVSAFAVIDQFLLHVADKKKFPKMKDVLLMGHSAGGQTLHRYAFMTHLKPPFMSTPEDVANNRGFRKDIDVRFVIANPSSYVYLDKNRWAYSCGDHGSESCTEMTYMPYNFSVARMGWSVDFEYGDEGYRTTRGLGKPGPDLPFLCRDSKWDHWFYGLEWDKIDNGLIIPYISQHPDIDAAVRMYPHRDVVYLVGQNDTCTDNEFSFCDKECWTRDVDTAKCYRNHMDMRCPAMLQGPNRKQRALHYQRHLLEYYGKKVHNLFVVPNTGHQGGKMVSSKYGLTAIEGTIKELLHLSIDPHSIPLGPVHNAPTESKGPSLGHRFR
eukprot:TRINITY_DN76073_c0_g1_i1.p1 TRINITY_DN76073_c0_g1~~TRINITY_DN76073_c0_g1_i1.p1  ORF type:complete len:579 (+),score=80.41 TRINITY_DN76073_c0_g1_i1:70-1806(+)